MLKNSSPFILELNTIILYVLAAGIAGVLIFFYIRSRLQIRRMNATDNPGPFGRMSRSVKLTRWRILCERYPGLSEMVKWLDAQLLSQKRTDDLELFLRQEWCCEDRTPSADAPIRCRPCQLTITQEARTTAVFNQFSFQAHQYLKEEETQLLGWILLEEVRRLLPFRSYRMKTDRITRRYQVENDVRVAWKDCTVRMENYSIRVSRR